MEQTRLKFSAQLSKYIQSDGTISLRDAFEKNFFFNSPKYAVAKWLGICREVDSGCDTNTNDIIKGIVDNR